MVLCVCVVLHLCLRLSSLVGGVMRKISVDFGLHSVSRAAADERSSESLGVCLKDRFSTTQCAGMMECFLFLFCDPNHCSTSLLF